MKVRINAEEWEKIEDESSAAKYFLKDKRFEFIRNYINEVINSSRDLVVENRIEEVREVTTVSDRFKKVFIRPKQIQVDETVGAYKTMRQFMRDMERFAILRDELEQEALKNKIIIERGKE